MKTSNMIGWIVGVVIIIGLLGWAISRIVNTAPPGELGTVTVTSTSTPTTTTTTGTKAATGGQTTTSVGPKESYVNSTYNFSISYPAEFNVEPFGVFHHLNNNDWRVNATMANRGTPVISVPVLHFDNETAPPSKRVYPLYFGAEVRIGVSPDTVQCYEKDNGYTTQTITNVNINGVTWKKFIFGDAAMMQYVTGASYRTIHNNKCYVIEQVRTGSIYRDAQMTEKYSDKALDAIYAKTTPIVMSFKFTK